MATPEEVREIMGTLLAWYPGKFAVNDVVIAKWEEGLADIPIDAVRVALDKVGAEASDWPPGLLKVAKLATDAIPHLSSTRYPQQVGWITTGDGWKPFLWLPD